VKRLVLILLLFLAGASVAMGAKLSIAPNKLHQGQTMFINISSLESECQARVDFNNQQINCYKTGPDSFLGIVGIPCELKPGHYSLRVKITWPDGHQQAIEKQLIIRPYPFAATSFWLKPTKKKLLKTNIVQDGWSKIEKELIKESAQKYWQHSFVLPAKGPISMSFGTKEKVNGRQRGQHRGLDLAVISGSDVKAANNGRVVLAEALQAFGKTIVIDHGQGVHSLYFHLSEFMSEVGDQVIKGEVIGLSGNTGVSSGPHLHWGMSVHNLRVNPMQWTKLPNL